MIARINRHAEPRSTINTDYPGTAEPLEVWHDHSGRRCVTPPDGMVISWELRKWYGMFDVDEERALANEQARQHRLKYGNEQLADDIAHDKRRKGYKHARQSG